MWTPSAFLTPSIPPSHRKGQGAIPKVAWPGRSCEVHCSWERGPRTAFPAHLVSNPVQGGPGCWRADSPFGCGLGEVEARQASAWSAGSYPRWASSPSPQAPGSKYRSLTADGGHGTPASDPAFLSSPLESHPYHLSPPNPQCSDPLALIFNDLYWEVGFQRDLNLPHSADDFPEVKGFWFSHSSTTKSCSYLLHWISSHRWETLNPINGTSLLGDIK